MRPIKSPQSHLVWRCVPLLRATGHSPPTTSTCGYRATPSLDAPVLQLVFRHRLKVGRVDDDFSLVAGWHTLLARLLDRHQLRHGRLAARYYDLFTTLCFLYQL